MATESVGCKVKDLTPTTMRLMNHFDSLTT
jgi:hypothetical protein